MEFSVNRETLSKKLLIISHQALTKPALPILANTLLEAEKGNLKISATNLELGAILTVEARVKKSGKITLPAKTLTDFILTLTRPEVEFKLENSEVEVSSGASAAKIPTISADEYPTIPTISKTLVEISGKKLTEIFERIIFAASQDSGRPILTGVLAEFKNDGVGLVATDGYRLSFEKISLGKNPTETSVVIPAKTLGQLTRVIPEEKETSVRILFDGAVNQIGFDVGKTYLVSRLIDGAFPDWQKIIPQTFKTKALISTAEFLQAVKTASVFAKEAGNTIRLSFGKNLEIQTQSGVGTSKTSVAAKISGDAVEVAFNWRYLAEALQAMPSESVEVAIVESLSPVKFTPVKSSLDFFHIVMPVRVA